MSATLMGYKVKHRFCRLQIFLPSFFYPFLLSEETFYFLWRIFFQVRHYVVTELIIVVAL